MEAMSCRRCGRFSGPELLCVRCDEAQSDLAARIVAEGSPSPTLAALQRRALTDVEGEDHGQ